MEQIVQVLTGLLDLNERELDHLNCIQTVEEWSYGVDGNRRRSFGHINILITGLDIFL
jgi:hypothetical protein